MSSNQQISDFIYYYPEAINPLLCNTIINYFNANAKWKQSTFSTAYKNTGTSQVSMMEYWIGFKDSYYQDLKNSFEDSVNDYTSVHKKIKVQAYTDFRINCYGQGGFMKEHIDNIHYSHGQKQGYPHLTSLIFLNDDFDGGEFYLCGESLEKKVGSAVVFPSNFMYPHEVKKVTNGKRYSVMTWIL